MRRWGWGRRAGKAAQPLLVGSLLLSLGSHVMVTGPASAVPPGVPGAVQVISTSPDRFCWSFDTAKVWVLEPLCAFTTPLPVTLSPVTLQLYVIATVPPVGSPETLNVTVAVGGSGGGHGPLYVPFVMTALAETVTAALDDEGGAVLPPGPVGRVVGGSCDGGIE